MKREKRKHILKQQQQKYITIEQNNLVQPQHLCLLYVFLIPHFRISCHVKTYDPICSSNKHKKCEFKTYFFQSNCHICNIPRKNCAHSFIFSKTSYRNRFITIVFEYYVYRLAWKHILLLYQIIDNDKDLWIH